MFSPRANVGPTNRKKGRGPRLRQRGPLPYQEMKMTDAKQFRSWIVCQVCGRTTTPEASEHWLNQPHRERWDIRVVRCPEHWSEWALRHTREGRTKDNRARMATALAQPVPPIPAYASPFPVRERDDPQTNAVRV